VLPLDVIKTIRQSLSAGNEINAKKYNYFNTSVQGFNQQGLAKSFIDVKLLAISLFHNQTRSSACPRGTT
jgi:hypothetical protein